MIDFTKELEKFDFMEIDKTFIDIQNETVIIIESLNATLKRIGKEQSKTNMQIEEILTILDEEKEKEKLISELKKSEVVFEEDKTALVKGLISILDQLEDMYRYSLKHDTDSRAEQMRILWKNISSSLMICGIMRIDEQHVFFNAQLNIAVQTRYEEEFPEGYILEVLKCGYKYNSVVLRKAQVVVNMKYKDSGEDE
ncbi:MAG: nucleotide exchange factor GrpE [Clostridiales bacterium GWB2_37_7]|nr:MAG: nucleotide exchange factor GrpE [Clostridiales bacterium GWB2_37_7]